MMTGYLISSNFSKMIFSQQKLAETWNFNKKKDSGTDVFLWIL